MKFENTNVYNMLDAIRAMRLSYGSKGDSFWDTPGTAIGRKDAKLIRNLVENGPSHRKFMRAILLSVDITAPRYWWIQFYTYKVGVTAISESTMHTLMKRKLSQSDFARTVPVETINRLEELRRRGLFEDLVSQLPQGYLQKRHVAMNYEVAHNIIAQRKGHKLAEWREFIEWAQGLPCAELFFGDLIEGGNK